jgi:hypothetical protein
LFSIIKSKRVENMKIKSSQIVLGVAMALSLACGASGFADSTSGSASGTPSGTATPGQHRHHHMKAVIQACAAADGITLPAKGSGEKLSTADKATMHSCVATFKQNMQSCAQAAGVPKPAPGEWSSLTADQKSTLKQCKTQALAKVSSAGAPSSSTQ